MLNKPLKKKHKDIECILYVGLYQIIYQQTPSHAAVNEAVKAGKALKKPWSKGLINGVLRTYLREKDSIHTRLNKDETAIYSHPQWLIGKLKKAWKDNWQDVLHAGNQHAPMTLRINTGMNTREQYLQKLRTANIPASTSDEVDSAVLLDKPVNVYDLPDFTRGACSVQDAAAQLSASLLQCEPKMKVLDACAAPGGKTGHLLELYAEINLIAIDNNLSRMERVKENLQRIGKQAELIQADAADTADWFDGDLFDRILLDAPCSATGVIRRHPDIKILRQPEDIPTLVQQQRNLLNALWSILKPGGLLLYATCSILPEENDKQIKTFTQKHNDVNIVPIDTTWGIQQAHGLQILPGITNMDGFYYSLLQKI